MGSALEDRLDERLRKRILQGAVDLLTVQDEIWRSDMATEMNVRQIKLINQGSQWLIVVTALVQGVPKVKMATITDIAQLGGTVSKMMGLDDWKPDKYAAGRCAVAIADLKK